MSADLRFGILSAASIANVFATAVNVVPGVRLTSVAARDPERAKQFAQKHSIPGTCTYEELIARDDVDAIYIPLPTSLATSWAVKAATAGKHVLVDKPFDSASGVRSIVSACRIAGVVFLDGTHFVHSRRLSLVRSALYELDPSVPVRRVVTSFSHPITLRSGAIRADPSLEPMGGLGDLGWYNVRVFVSLVGAAACADVAHAWCDAEEHPVARGVVNAAAGGLRLRSGQTLLFDCDMRGPSRQRFEAVARTGCVRVRDFVLPERTSFGFESARKKAISDGRAERAGAEAGFEVERTCRVGEDGELTLEWPERTHVDVDEGGTQPEAMVRAFAKLVAEGAGGMGRATWAQETLATQDLLDRLFVCARESMDGNRVASG